MDETTVATGPEQEEQGRGRWYDAFAAPFSLRKLLLGVPAAIVAAGIAVAIVLGGGSTYRSQTLVLIDQPQLLVESSDVGVVVKLNALRAKYVGLIGTSGIVDPVAGDVGVAPGVVRSSVSGDLLTDTLVFRVVAETGDRELARELSQAVAERLDEFADQEQASAGIASDLRVDLEIVERASPAAEVSPSATRAALAGVTAALITLAAAYFGLQAWARTRGEI